MAVLLADLAGGDELEVAVGADVVVAVVALGAVEAGCRGRDGVGADIALCGEGEDVVGIVLEGNWRRCEGGGCGAGIRGVCCGRRTRIPPARGNSTDRKQRMGAASPLVDAAVAEPPFSVVALAAFPEAVVGQRMAYVAEYAFL